MNAQKGTAPDGYYPAAYMGSTFTGSLQPAGNAPSRFTMLYTKKRQVGNVFRSIGREVQVYQQSRRDAIFPNGSLFRWRSIERLLQDG